MRGWIGITLGDVSGVGPEVTLKALAAEAHADELRYLLIGDEARLEQLNRQLGLQLPLQPFADAEAAGRFFTHNPLAEALPPDVAPGSAAAANAAMAWLKEGAARCLRKELDALVTAPVNKESIIRAGHAFVGQTEYLSQLAGTERTAMMLLGQDERGRWLRVVLATTHLPLRMVADKLTQPKIELAIDLAGKEACADLGLPQARVAVCGLNPHAGEGGEIGTEEITVITPAVRPRAGGTRRWPGRSRRTRCFTGCSRAIMKSWWRCITIRDWCR